LDQGLQTASAVKFIALDGGALVKSEQINRRWPTLTDYAAGAVMRVDWKQDIHGVRILTIRDLLRHLGSRHVSVRGVAERLAVSEEQARKIARELLERGWIEREPQERGNAAFYSVTAAGSALACTKAVPRIGRRKANQLLEAFVQRIDLVNSRDCLLHHVAEARLFGSYIDPLAEDLGDIDIAIRLVRRPVNGRDPVKYALKRADYLGKRTGSSSRATFYCANELRAVLVARSPYISLADMCDLEEIKAASMPLWPAHHTL
jgi:predicted nucleotidyltransferase/DNA-binding MarR family transcriptional regulator